MFFPLSLEETRFTDTSAPCLQGELDLTWMLRNGIISSPRRKLPLLFPWRRCATCYLQPSLWRNLSD